MASAVQIIDVQIRGQRFSVECDSHRRQFWEAVASGRWEAETFEAIDAVLSRNGTAASVVDIGGWIGPITFYCASRGADVLTFEPDPVAHAELVRNLAVNDFPASVAVESGALGPAPGVGRLASARLGDSAASLVRSSAGDGTEVPILGVRETALHLEFARAQLIKIDIEGMEFDVVPPLIDVLATENASCDLLLSTHSYPTLERLMTRVPRALRRSGVVDGLWRRVIRYLVLPFAMAPRSLKLAFSLRPFRTRRLAVRNSAGWKPLGTAHVLRYLIAPDDGELWLSNPRWPRQTVN